MKTYRYITPAAVLLSLLAASCSDAGMGGDRASEESREILLQARIRQVNLTRADDSGFADSDHIGIYVVNYDGDTPGALLAEGNQATNVRFTYDGAAEVWKGDRQLYFKDDNTAVDVYGVYPYRSDIPDVGAFRFSVAKNQDLMPSDGTMGNYEASDLLWGKTPGVMAADGVITVVFNHILAGLSISLVEGDGFDAGEWTALDKTAYVAGTCPDALVDLSTGEATPAGTGAVTITASRRDDGFRAVAVPQTVAAGTPLVLLNVGSESYRLVKSEDFALSASRLHKFTIRVDKTTPQGDYAFTLAEEAITAWENDPESHDGEAREYVVVDVPEFGGLEKAVADAGLNPANVVNLKVTGKMDPDDFAYMRGEMANIEALNLREVTVKGEIWQKYEHLSDLDKELTERYNGKEMTFPNLACDGMISLRHVVLPEKLRAIGDQAFRNTALSGTIVFPEGLEFIGMSAIGMSYGETDKKSLTGELHLPSTLQYIRGGAFSSTDFTGELILPASLKYIGDGAFERCMYMKGRLHLPENLEYVGQSAFFRMTGISGELVYPRSATVVSQLAADTQIESVRLPEAPVEIADGAFRGMQLRGDLTIPASVRKLGREALSGTKLSHVIFPEKIDIDIVPGSFLDNNRFLIDTIKFPESVEIIGENVLRNCDRLDAVVIPRKTVSIGAGAFAGCSSLTYIRCDAVEPPEVPENAFEGINKDNFTLEVPEQSVDRYRAAPAWKEFRRIAAYKNFVARPLKYNLLNKGGEREIVLNADGDWEMTEMPEWCSLDITSGTKKTTLRLTIEDKPHDGNNRQGKVVFRLKGEESHTTSVTVTQYDYEHEEDSYVTFREATKGKGINLFFVGDGYDAADISSGKMLDDMREEMEFFFGVEPYTTYREYFNVYCGIALSDDSGIEDVSHWRKTKFHSVVSNSDTRLTTDWMAAMNYAGEICPPLTACDPPQVGCILVLNTPLYEGVTYIGDSFCAVVTRSELDYPNDARGIIQHEAGGHGIGWLGDEYKYHNAFIHNCPCICCSHADALEFDHSLGYALNVSLNGKFRQVPWYHLITNPDYSDIVDVYEGGYFHARGVYRSEYNSCMNNNVPYFSTWSRQLIVQRIMKLAGEEFSLDSFYANDKRGMGGQPGTKAGSLLPTAPMMHGRPPVRVKNFTFGKKGGKR